MAEHSASAVHPISCAVRRGVSTSIARNMHVSPASSRTPTDSAPRSRSLSAPHPAPKHTIETNIAHAAAFLPNTSEIPVTRTAPPNNTPLAGSPFQFQLTASPSENASSAIVARRRAAPTGPSRCFSLALLDMTALNERERPRTHEPCQAGFSVCRHLSSPAQCHRSNQGS